VFFGILLLGYSVPHQLKVCSVAWKKAKEGFARSSGEGQGW